jgi:hypothetical protein
MNCCDLTPKPKMSSGFRHCCGLPSSCQRCYASSFQLNLATVEVASYYVRWGCSISFLDQMIASGECYYQLNYSSIYSYSALIMTLSSSSKNSCINGVLLHYSNSLRQPLLLPVNEAFTMQFRDQLIELL